ncbi:DHA2 family efflux MFS transporter permease subunit [Actinoplanes subtropicus]|uniref:DHA2 family efflux MFS transporter permease subunit n=1 Tax=Actinoplanes subtropicus TaxID=543632 RepID=UPI000690DF3C|nr:DHA2 family efflux MFS transporter permease subunit [Actinoplanes subtropicus]
MSGTSGYRSYRGWTLAVTSVAFFMVALDALVVTTALPMIGRDLGAGMASLQWTVNTYGLAYAAGIITAAALGDRYGRRRVFTTGLAVFTAASACCALAPGVGWLLAARTVQGMGAAAVMPLSLTILTDAFPPQRRGAIVGIWGGLGGLAVAGGPLVGGVVTEGLDWHWIFWLNVPIGLAGVALSRARLPRSATHPAPLDIPALVLLAGGASALVWGLVRASTVGWTAAQTLVAIAGGVLLVAGFVARERRTVAPMLPLRLFRTRDFAAANATALLMIAALSAAVFLIAQYFQLVLHYSPLATGLRLLPWTATPLLVAPLAGRLSDRIGRRPVLATGMLLQATGLGWFALIAGATPHYAEMVAALLMAGVGISMALPTTATAAMNAVAPAELGKASGTNSTMQRLGGVFGVAVVTAVFTANGRLGNAVTFTDGLRPALTVAAGLSLLGVLSALALHGRATADHATVALTAARIPDLATVTTG